MSMLKVINNKEGCNAIPDGFIEIPRDIYNSIDKNFDYLLPRSKEDWDNPINVLNGCIAAQQEVLQGFWGNESADKKKLGDAMMPKHIAISLSGEPTLYPY